MKERRGGVEAFGVLLFGLLPIALLFTAYLFYYVQSRNDSLTQRNFRALATMGRNLASRLEAMNEPLRNRKRNGDSKKDGDAKKDDRDWVKKLPNLTAERCLADEEESKPLAWTLFDSRSQSRLSFGCRTVDFQKILKPQQQPNLFDDLLLVQADTSRVVYHWHAFDTGALPDLTTLLNVASAKGGTKSSVKPEPKDTGAGDGGKSAGDGEKASERDGARRFDFAEPVPLNYFGERYFVYFVPLVLDFTFARGKQSEPAARRNGEATDGGGDSDETGEEAVQESGSISTAVNPDSRADEGGEQLVLCGLIRQDQFNAEKRELSLSLLLALAMVLLFALLLWPLLKLWFLGARERLDALNVYVLGIALNVTLGLLTAGVLDALIYRGLTARLDRELIQLGEQMNRRLDSDIELALDTLSEGAKAMEEGRDLSEGVRVRERTIEQVLQIDASGKPLAMWNVTVGSNGKDGKVRRRDVPGWSNLESLTFESADVPERLNVGDRGYFQDVHKGRLWNFDAHRFAVEVVQSRLDGRSTIVLAVPLKEHTSNEMAILTLRPRSVFGPSLPPGFSFAIIDRYGKVMLHSDERRILQENLFQESEETGRLESAVAVGREQLLDAFYYGQAYRFYALPVKGGRWSLVVMYNKKQLRHVNAGIVIIWGVLFTIYVIGVVLAALLFRGFSIRHRAAWLWPQRELTSSYGVASFLCLLTLVCCFAVYEPDGAGAQLVRVIVAPLMAILVVYVLLAARTTVRWFAAVAALWLSAAILHATSLGGPSATSAPFLVPLATMGFLPFCEPKPVASERGFRIAYTLMLFALLVVMGPAPSAVLFDDALDQSMVSFLRWTQYESLGKRAGLLAKPNEGHGSSDEVDGIYIDLFQHAAEEGAGGNGTAESVVGGRLASWLEGRPLNPRLAAHVFPRLSLRSAETLGLDQMVATTATDGSWRWYPDETGRDERRGRMEVPNGQAGGYCDLQCCDIPGVDGRVPSFFADAGLDAWLIASGAALALVIGAFFVLGAIARRLFLLDADADGTVNVPLRPRTSRGLYMLWRPFRTLVADGNPDRLVEWVNANTIVCDLARHSPGECLRSIDRLVPASNAMVIVDHFEARLTEKKGGRGTLELLTRLDELDHAVVVVLSDLDPLPFFAAADEDAAEPSARGPSKGGSDVSRFADVLRDYHGTAIFPGEPGLRGDGGDLGPALAAALGRRASEQVEEGRGEGRHWRLWNRLAKREKLALIQLAEEGFLNPKIPEVARSLMQRGLVRRDPAFVIADGGFPAFVAGAESYATVRAWESEGARSSWAKLRPALLILLVFGVGFLYATQRGLFSETIAFATAITGTIPLLLRLFASLGRQPEGGSAGR